MANLFVASVIAFCFIFSCIGMTAFEAYASAPSIALSKDSSKPGEEITVAYSGTDSKDWIGIYPKGEAPGPKPALRWCYAENGSGSVSLIAQSLTDAGKPLTPGDYTIYLCDNDGYNVLDHKDYSITGNTKPQGITVAEDRTVTILPGEYYDNKVSYNLYLGNSSGKLPGYTNIGNVKLINGKYVYKVGSNVVFPSEATHLYAYAVMNGTEMTDSASCKINDSTFYNSIAFGKKLYEFQIFTDIHIDRDGAIPIHDTHFKLALQDVLEHSPDSKGIITIGDNTNNGFEEQWQRFVSIRDSVLKDGLPKMYFTMGNHDRDMNGSYEQQVALFKKYTDSPAVYYSFKIENNTFIVLGSEKKGSTYMSQAQLDWLRLELEKAPKDSPVFVFLHEPIENTVSGSLSKLNPTIQDWWGFKQEDEVHKIVDPYANVMFFTGHTHWHFDNAQPMLYGGGKTANYFNAAAVAYLWDDNDQSVSGSQGYYVEVYDNGIFVRGRDFENSDWAPEAQFFIPLAQSPATSQPTDAGNTKAPSSPVPVPDTKDNGPSAIVVTVVILSVVILGVAVFVCMRFRKQKQG